MGCGGGGQSGALLNQQAAQQKAVEAGTNNVLADFSGFTPDFYQGIAKAYTNYQQPNIQGQYLSNEDAYKYKLANQGLDASSQARQGFGALADAYTQGQQQIAAGGQQQAQQLQQQVGQQENTLLNEVQSANIPGAINTQAQALAAGFQAPSTFAPIGQLFNNWAQQYLGAQNANTFGNFSTQYLNNISNPGLYSLLNNTNASGAIPSNSQ